MSMSSILKFNFGLSEYVYFNIWKCPMKLCFVENVWKKTISHQDKPKYFILLFMYMYMHIKIVYKMSISMV